MYYPKSQIIENQYTNGEAFVDIKKVPYKGYYYSTYDGRFFTGSTYTPDSKELFKTIKIDNRQNYQSSLYDKIGTPINNSIHPSFHYSLPTDEDYNRGFYTRYFSKRVNGDILSIKEIDKKQFDSLKNNILYTIIEIPWRISGNIYDDENIGVINSNSKILKNKEKDIPGISKYILNPLQFYK